MVQAKLWLKRYWQVYANRIKRNLLGKTEEDLHDISHWRSAIFVNMITYVFPFSIFALVPGIIMTFANGMPIVGFADICVFFLLYLLAMDSRMSLSQRKFIFTSIIFILGLIILLNDSWSGPGLLLLLANTMFVAMIYSSSAAYLAAWINTFICFIIWLLIYFSVGIPLKDNYDAATWFAIASNLILISFICAKFLSQLLKGMETSFNNGKKMHANLTATINSTGASIYSVDRSLRFISFNTAVKDVMKKHYNIDLKLGDLLHNPDGPGSESAAFWDDVHRQAFSGVSLQFERDYTLGNDLVTVYFSINPIKEDGEVIGMSCFCTNITAQRKMRIERDKTTDNLIERNKNLEQFSYIVSHNLRAPAANILGLAELLKHQTLLPSENMEVIDGIYSSTQKLDGIIKDLNEILRVRTSLIENRQWVYFQKLVDDISLSVDYLTNPEQLVIKTDFQEIDRMSTLRSYLYSIFDNLIKNSIKFQSSDRPLDISITSRLSSDGIQLIFRDNGVGIDLSRNKGKIFGLYNRFHPQIEGKGIGLFMVKTQVEVLGGKITVESDTQKGTTFIINFENKSLNGIVNK